MEANNAAALREVVKELLDAIYDMGIDEETVSIAAESPNCHMHSVELLSVIKKAKAAIAKPPRNCDVYDAKTAEKEFIRQTGSKSIRSKSVRWLYAPYNSEAAESLNRKEM